MLNIFFFYVHVFSFSHILTNRSKLIGQVLWNASYFSQMLNPDTELFPENTNWDNNEMLHYYYHAYMPAAINDSSECQCNLLRTILFMPSYKNQISYFYFH
jgi:hypothetical protein